MRLHTEKDHVLKKKKSQIKCKKKKNFKFDTLMGDVVNIQPFTFASQNISVYPISDWVKLRAQVPA